MKVAIPSYNSEQKIEIFNAPDAPDAEDIPKSYCTNVCQAIPLVFKNFKMKMADHLLLGGEHVKKVSPAFYSPVNIVDNLTSEEKKVIVQ